MTDSNDGEPLSTTDRHLDNIRENILDVIRGIAIVAPLQSPVHNASLQVLGSEDDSRSDFSAESFLSAPATGAALGNTAPGASLNALSPPNKAAKRSRRTSYHPDASKDQTFGAPARRPRSGTADDAQQNDDARPSGEQPRDKPIKKQASGRHLSIASRKGYGPYNTISSGAKSLKNYRQSRHTLGPSDMKSILNDKRPITDVKVLLKGEKVPAGYFRIFSQHSTHPICELNKGSSGKSVQICCKKSSSEPPVTAIAVVFEGQDEFVPFGFTIIDKTVGGVAADLNSGTMPSRAFLCIRRGEGVPITQLALLYPDRGEVVPRNFGVLERSPQGHAAVFNTKKNACLLCFSRDNYEIEAVSGLRPLDRADLTQIRSPPGNVTAINTNIAHNSSVQTSRSAQNGEVGFSAVGAHDMQSPMSLPAFTVGQVTPQSTDDHGDLYPAGDDAQQQPHGAHPSSAPSERGPLSDAVAESDQQSAPPPPSQHKLTSKATAPMPVSSSTLNPPSPAARCATTSKGQTKLLNTGATVLRSHMTRLENARASVIKRNGGEDIALGIGGNSGAFSPQVCGLLMHPEYQRLVHPVLLACVSDDVSTMLDGLNGLLVIIVGDIQSLSQTAAMDVSSGQLTLGDYVIKLASNCIELGIDVLIAPAVRVLLAAVETIGQRGLHPISVHFVMVGLLNAKCFFRLDHKKYVKMDPEQSRDIDYMGPGTTGSSSTTPLFASGSHGTVKRNSTTSVQSLDLSGDLQRHSAEAPLHGGRHHTGTTTSVSSSTSCILSSSGEYSSRHFIENARQFGVTKQDYDYVHATCDKLLEILVTRANDASTDTQSAQTAKQVFQDEEMVSAFRSASHREFAIPKAVSPPSTSLKPPTRTPAPTTAIEDTPPQSVSEYIENYIIKTVLLERVSELRQMMENTESAETVLARHHSCSVEFSLDLHISTRKLYYDVRQRNVLMAMLWLSHASSTHRRNVKTLSKTMTNVALQAQLASLKLLHRFLNIAASNMGAFVDSPLFGYQIRRFVCPTIIPMCQTRAYPIFQQLLAIITDLWKYFRKHLKIELGLMLEAVLLKILRSPFSRNSQKLDVLETIVSWYDMQPVHLVEIFLNFQNDPPVKHWKIMEDMVELLCTLGEGTAKKVVDASDEASDTSQEDLQLYALRALVTFMRSLMDASASAHLMAHDDRLREKSVVKEGEHGWEQEQQNDSVIDDASQPTAIPSDGTNPVTATTTTASTAACHVDREDAVAGHQGGMKRSSKYGDAKKPRVRVRSAHGGKQSHFRRSSVRQRHELQQQNKDVLSKAIKIANEEGKGVRKAIQYLIAMNYIEETPVRVANLLRVNQKEFGEKPIGEYLGQEGKSAPEKVFMEQVRICFVQQTRFAGKGFEDSLRTFLTKGGFRLPGESQQIERLLEAFAHCYYNENPNVFKSADTVLVLAFSTVMLNTDTHNRQVKKKGKMTKDQFVRNLSGLDEGEDLPRKMLEEIYDSIQMREIKMIDRPAVSGDRTTNKRSGGTSHHRGSFTGGSHAASASQAQANTGHDHGSLAGGERKLEDGQLLTRAKADEWFEVEMGEAARRAMAILSGQSLVCRVHHSKVNADSISVMFEVVWVHFFGIIGTVLENPKTYSLEMVSQALDMLRYAISASLFLGLEMERRAFATLLAKINYLNSESGNHWNRAGEFKRQEAVGVLTGKHLEQDWFKRVMNASTDDQNVIDIIADVHHLAISMKERVTQRHSYEQLVAIQNRFDSSLQIVDNSRREFIREGQLVKRCRRQDRKYTFFLFTDMLVYASSRFGGKWHVHQQLPLRTMRIADLTDRMFSKNAFEIRSPIKTFVVMTPTQQSKVEWLRDLTEAIDVIARQSKETRRLSLLPALGDDGSREPSPSPSKIALSNAVTPVTAALDTDNETKDETSINDATRTDLGGESKRQSGGSVEGAAAAPVPDAVAIPSMAAAVHADTERVSTDLSAGKAPVSEAPEKQADRGGANGADAGIVNMTDTESANGADTGPTTGAPVADHAAVLSNQPEKKALQSRSTNNTMLDSDSDNSSDDEDDIVDSDGEGLLMHENEKEEETVHSDIPPAKKEYSESELQATFLQGLVFSQPILLARHEQFVASDEEKLTMYACFKQSTQGDCNKPKPGEDDWVSLSKWRAWCELKGVGKGDAQRRFLEVLDKVAPGWRGLA